MSLAHLFHEGVNKRCSLHMHKKKVPIRRTPTSPLWRSAVVSIFCFRNSTVRGQSSEAPVCSIKDGCLYHSVVRLAEEKVRLKGKLPMEDNIGGLEDIPV